MSRKDLVEKPTRRDNEESRQGRIVKGNRDVDGSGGTEIKLGKAESLKTPKYEIPKGASKMQMGKLTPPGADEKLINSNKGAAEPFDVKRDRKLAGGK